MKKRILCGVLLLLTTLFCSACGSAKIETVSGADERVAEAYRQGVAYYEDKTELEGFWDVSAAYDFLGDEIYGREITAEEEESHRGAVILSLIMTGENPYDYEGRDPVQELLDHGTDGSFSVPVFNFLALQAAGAEMDEETEAAYIDYCCEQMETLELGPDIGGWAAAALVRYVDDPRYEEAVASAVETYTSAVGENLTAGSMGSGGITTGCVVLGLTALTSAGLEGYDPLTDSPWAEQDPIALMYENLTEGEENVSDYYKSQYYLEFADLYHVLYEDMDMTWLRCGVTEERLDALMEEAETLSGDPAVEEALAALKELSEEERSAAVPRWGRLYYDLFDAVKAASE